MNAPKKRKQKKPANRRRPAAITIMPGMTPPIDQSRQMAGLLIKAMKAAIAALSEI